MNEKPQVVRSPEPRVGAAREEEERRRVAEIAREIEEWDLDLLAQRLTARQNAETEADARKAAEENVLADEWKAAEEKRAAAPGGGSAGGRGKGHG